MNDYPFLASTAIAIVGERGSGKTALACHLLDQVQDQGPVFVYQHQDPDLIATRGWQQMYRLEQLYDIHSSVVWLDEPQITIPKLDKRANEGLQRLLSIARHRDITLILSTCDTRWITRALESFIDCWLVKDVEPRLVKQGALIKKIIQRHVLCDPDEFRLPKHQYLFYGRHYDELDGLHEFVKPEYFDERWSKPYRAKIETATGSATDVASGLREAS
jgi:hypothetical protein